MTSEPPIAGDSSQDGLGRVIDEMGNQLCRALDGDFGLRVRVETDDAAAQKLQMLVNFVLDTTQQNADEGLAKSQELDAIFKTTVDGIVTIDSDGTIRAANPAAQDIFGYSSRELLGKPIEMLMPAPYAGEHQSYVDNYLATGEKGVIDTWREVTGKRADGTEFPLELGITQTLFSQGRRFTGIVRDISERKQVEAERKRLNQELLRALKVKGEFLATMSHEIRTPINGLMGFAELLGETELDDEQATYVRAMDKCSKSLLELVNDVLEFSKIEAGKLELETIEFDLRSCIDEVPEMLGPKAWEKGLDVAVIFRCGVARRVKGDPTRLRQILVNLVGNAIKFTDKGEVVVEVDAIQASRLGDKTPYSRIRISVRDTGIGISEDQLGDIFESFTQADASTTRRYGGTGLGLAICKKIVDVMGGEIGVESREGEGSTFSFWIDLEVCEPAESVEDRRVDLEGLRALIVDDHEPSRQVFREMLARWGCGVEEAEDAETGFELLRAAATDGHAFDFVILDYVLPGMNGDELLELIRSVPEIRETPILMATSKPQRGDGRRLREMGLDAYLTKPVPAASLAAAIRMVLARSGHESGADTPLITQHNLREMETAGSEVLVICAEGDSLPGAVSALTRAGREVDLARTLEEARAACEEAVYQAIFFQVDRAEAWTRTEDLRTMLAPRGGGRVPMVALGAEPDGEAEESLKKAGFDAFLPSIPTAQQLAEIFERK